MPGIFQAEYFNNSLQVHNKAWVQATQNNQNP